MNSILTYILILSITLSSCGSNDKACKTLSCKLTTPELRKRKETVIASLKKQVLETKELDNGFAYKFNNSASTKKELNEFMISEKECCNFFDFKLTTTTYYSSLSMGEGRAEVTAQWLEITGPAGTKQFKKTELAM